MFIITHISPGDEYTPVLDFLLRHKYSFNVAASFNELNPWAQVKEVSGRRLVEERNQTQIDVNKEMVNATPINEANKVGNMMDNVITNLIGHPIPRRDDSRSSATEPEQLDYADYDEQELFCVIKDEPLDELPYGDARQEIVQNDTPLDMDSVEDQKPIISNFETDQNRRRSRRESHHCNVDNCTAMLPTLVKLKEHVESEHPGRKAFVCDYCGKEFGHRRGMELHTRIHTGYAPYECNQCDYRSKYPGDIHKHMRTRHGGKKKSYK